MLMTTLYVTKLMMTDMESVKYLTVLESLGASIGQGTWIMYLVLRTLGVRLTNRIQSNLCQLTKICILHNMTSSYKNSDIRSVAIKFSCKV